MIENNTQYNKDMIRNYVKLLCRRRMIYADVISILMVAIGFILLGVRGHGLRSFNIALGISVVLQILEEIDMYLGKKMLIQRYQTIHHTDTLVCNMVFDSEKTVMVTNYRRLELLHEDIKKVLESDDLFVLIYRGNTSIPIDKNGFTKGSVGELQKLINSYMK